MVTLGNPDSPVDVFAAEGDVIAFDAADDTASEVVLDVPRERHQRAVDVRQNRSAAGSGR